jgi:hypothetical protein
MLLDQIALHGLEEPDLLEFEEAPLKSKDAALMLLAQRRDALRTSALCPFRDHARLRSSFPCSTIHRREKRIALAQRYPPSDPVD